MLLHGAALAWVGFKFPGLSRMVKIEPAPALRVKLNHHDAVVTLEKPTTPASVPFRENSPGQQDSREPVGPASGGGWGFDMERALSSESGPALSETLGTSSRRSPNSEPEALDMSASHYAVQELDLPESNLEPIPNRGADVFDPQVRQRLQASRRNRRAVQPDLFQEVNNRTLTGGSQMASFGDACFEITDATGGRSSEKMWLRTQCLGKTLSERMLDNVEKVLETEQVELP